MAWKLISIEKSSKPDKKWVAEFFDSTTMRTKHRHFGQKGADDFTITGDVDQRTRYRARHKKDLDTTDPTKAGVLAWYVLWGEHKSISANVRAYKNKFKV